VRNSTKKNIIYIFADQLRLQSLGYFGDQVAKTPHLDRIAGESCHMTNAVSGHPVCSPYRASLFTGKYTTSNGMVTNEIRISPEHKTFAHVLNEEGYKTSYIGKWHLYANRLGNHDNSDNSYIPKGPDRLGFDDFFAAYNFHHEYVGEKSYYHLDSPAKISFDGYEPDCQTDMAIGELERLSEGEDPFALFLSLGTPHDPWESWNVPNEYYELFKDVEFNLPENFRKSNDPYSDYWACLSDESDKEIPEWMRVYYAMVSNLDHNIGRLYAACERMDLLTDSVFVFTSDHGEMFGAQGRRAKNCFYEEAVRVPFLLKDSNILNTVSDVCLNSVDIMPTLLSLLDLPIPEQVDGRDLSQAIKGFHDNGEPQGALLMSTGATAVFEDGHEWRGYRTKQYTYAEYLYDYGSDEYPPKMLSEKSEDNSDDALMLRHVLKGFDGRYGSPEEFPRVYLFDNENDPLQQKNLSENPRFCKEREALKQAMYTEMERIGDHFRPISYYKENCIVDRCVKQEKVTTSRKEKKRIV